MSTLEKAIQIAAKAHEGQLDKQGLPYILHPLRVMHKVEGNIRKIVAVLHDVLEDTSVTENDLREAGFEEYIIEAVKSVTRREDEYYTDYVIRAKNNPIGRCIKIADLEDNTRLDRLLLNGDTYHKDMARLKKYIVSYQYLTSKITKDDYYLRMTGRKQ